MGVRAHVFFFGKVQGVFFRDNTRRKALALGVSGWVRNLPDGSVEAVMEGEPQGVEELVEWCRSRQPSARVTEVQLSWEHFTGDFGTFEVRR